MRLLHLPDLTRDATVSRPEVSPTTGEVPRVGDPMLVTDQSNPRDRRRCSPVITFGVTEVKVTRESGVYGYGPIPRTAPPTGPWVSKRRQTGLPREPDPRSPRPVYVGLTGRNTINVYLKGRTPICRNKNKHISVRSLIIINLTVFIRSPNQEQSQDV